MHSSQRDPDLNFLFIAADVIGCSFRCRILSISQIDDVDLGILGRRIISGLINSIPSSCKYNLRRVRAIYSFSN